VDLISEGVDCVIRAGELADSSLVARRLALMPEVTCASPAYLGRFGTPRHPDELDGHRAVNFFQPGRERGYPFTFLVDGQVREVALPGWAAVDHAETYVSCAEQGAGLIQLPRYHVEPQLRAGSLVEVLADWPSPGLPASLLYHRHRQLSRRVRVFADWCAQVFAEHFPAPAPVAGRRRAR
jgi:DNA-binding transcriptional LysR family regulator